MRNQQVISHNMYSLCFVRKFPSYEGMRWKHGSLRLFLSQAGGIFGNVFFDRRCRFSSITTTSLGKGQENQAKRSSGIDFRLVNGKEISPTTISSELLKVHDSRTQPFTYEKRITDGKQLEWPATVLIFDIETTGFSREKDRIIEIAFRDLVGGRNSTFQTLVNPERRVSNTEVHKISTHMVTKPGVPRMKDLIPIMLKYVESRKIFGKPVVLMAHNGRNFDIPFLVREFDRCSAKIPDDWLFVDTLPIGRKLVNSDGTKLASVKLQALREHYRIPLVGQCHRAMGDVIVLSRVLEKMSFELKISITDLVESAFRASDLTTKGKA